MSVLIRNALLVTMNENMDIVNGDIWINDGKIEKIGELPYIEPDEVIDGTGKVVLPGFVQTHIHLCQTLFRGMAEDMELLDWLKKRIWKLEDAHTKESMYYSAMLGISEMVSCGTTTILDMGSTHHYEQVFRAAKESGFRMVGGKAMMDSGDDVPQTLGESTEDSLNECVDLIEKWHDSNDGRLKYAFAPRFLLSCTDELMKEIGKLAAKYDVMVHTHASENKNERKLVEKLRGNATIPHLKKLNLLNEKTILVHCVWLKDEDFDLLKEHDIKIAHCPSSNMKLASGIADTKRMLDSGLIVSLGADGAPCNNNLSIFQEMRLAALLQKLNYGPAAVSAKQIVKMATIDGAKALYLNEAIGSLEAGKKADIVILDLNLPHTIPENQEDIYTRIVYEADSRNVESVMIDGKWVMKNRQKSKLPEDLIEKTNQLAKDVYERAID